MEEIGQSIRIRFLDNYLFIISRTTPVTIWRTKPYKGMKSINENSWSRGKPYVEVKKSIYNSDRLSDDLGYPWEFKFGFPGAFKIICQRKQDLFQGTEISTLGVEQFFCLRILAPRFLLCFVKSIGK